jgi:hypothetical protein
MQFGRPILASALLLATAVPCFAYTHARRGPTSPNLHKKHPPAKPGGHVLGQRAMDSDRATQIQTALIKTGYLTGTPSGHWDAPSEAAMQKLQGDNGWQTKLTPDSRALIKLGLGPKQDTTEASTFSEASSSQSTQALRANGLMGGSQQ